MSHFSVSLKLQTRRKKRSSHAFLGKAQTRNVSNVKVGKGLWLSFGEEICSMMCLFTRRLQSRSGSHNVCVRYLACLLHRFSEQDRWFSELCFSARVHLRFGSKSETTDSSEHDLPPKYVFCLWRALFSDHVFSPGCLCLLKKRRFGSQAVLYRHVSILCFCFSFLGSNTKTGPQAGLLFNPESTGS